jgi:hypothetical protein
VGWCSGLDSQPNLTRAAGGGCVVVPLTVNSRWKALEAANILPQAPEWMARSCARAAQLNSQPLAGFLVFCKCGAILSQAFGAVPTSATATVEKQSTLDLAHLALLVSLASAGSLTRSCHRDPPHISVTSRTVSGTHTTYFATSFTPHTREVP